MSAVTTAPDIDAETIAEIDREPICEGRSHGDTPPRADYLADLHGCCLKFACEQCVQIDRDNFAKWGEEIGIGCRICGYYFRTFEQGVKLERLR